METSIIDGIGNLSDKVAKEHGQFEEAISTELQAKVDLMQAVVARVKPALSALGGWQTRWEKHHQNPSGTHHWEEEEYYDFHAVTVAGDGCCKSRETSTGVGNVSGDKLVLVTRDGDHNGGRVAAGTLIQIKYDGHWSCWQGSSDGWESTALRVTYDTAIEEYGLNAIIENLTEALEKQIDGKKGKRAEQAREKAARLSALVKLL